MLNLHEKDNIYLPNESINFNCAIRFPNTYKILISSNDELYKTYPYIFLAYFEPPPQEKQQLAYIL